MSLLRCADAVLMMYSLLGQTDLKSVLKKIACDEAVFGPQLACSYLAVSAYIESPGDWEAVGSNVENKVRKTEGRALRGIAHHDIDSHGANSPRVLRRVCLKLLVWPIPMPGVNRKPRRTRLVSDAREVENRGDECICL